MPSAAPRPCTHPSCGALVRDGSGRCPKHQRAAAVAQDERRGSSAQRGYGYKWQQAREQYLAANPLCVRHQQRGDVVAATVVDHITPHRLKEAIDSGDADRISAAQSLFWNRKNWQPLCKQCHDIKTAVEDGAFGRRRGEGGAKVQGLRA